LCEELLQFDFGEFPHHPLETKRPTILNMPLSRNVEDFNQMGVEARQFLQIYLSTAKEIFDSGNFG
jgi:hypothetical protein